MPQVETTNSQLKKLIETSRGKSYTIVIITALLILVLLFFAILPAVNSILLQLSQNEERLQALDKINAKRENLRLLVSKHDENLAVAVGLDRSLPFELNQADIMTDVLTFARNNNVEVYSVRFVSFEGRSRVLKELIDPGLVDGVIVNISVGGERAALRNFVTAVENSRRIYSLNTVSISQVEEQSSEFPFPFILNAQMEVFFWNVNKFSEF